MYDTHALGVTMLSAVALLTNIGLLLWVSHKAFDGKYSFQIYFGGFMLELLILGLILI